MPQISKREQIIEAATHLFHVDGFNATGIEKIRETANVSKKTLYNHFISKEELILAVLRREDENVRHWIMKNVEGISQKPRERLIGLFDVYASWIGSEGFGGCLFIKAASEFSDPENKCKVASTEAKRLSKQMIKQLVLEADASDPDILTDQLNLLIQGATVQAQAADDLTSIWTAKSIGLVLIEKSLRAGGTVKHTIG